MKTHGITVLCLVFCAGFLVSCGSPQSFMKGSTGYVVSGTTANFNIMMAYCTQGHWAANDLAFTLSAPDGSIFFEDSITRSKDWDYTLDTDKDLKQVYFEIAVPVPEELTEGTLFTGRLAGNIFCPRKGDIDHTQEVDIEVELHVTNADEIKSMSSADFWYSVKMGCYGLICIGLMALISSVAGKIRNPLKPKIGRLI